MEEKNYFMDRFDRRIFNHHEEHFCIGEGFFGGKASGLIFIENIIKENIDFTHYPDINISVPRMVILRTNVFDTFMKRNNLYDFALNEKSDVRILDRFLKADFPVEFLGDLYSFVEKVKVPLAVRSSGLLEDPMYEPFADVYATKMIPSNNQDT